MSKRIKLHGTQYDKRVRLSDDERAAIKALREESGMSYRAIAKEFGISPRLVNIICSPESYIRQMERQKEDYRAGRIKVDPKLQSENYRRWYKHQKEVQMMLENEQKQRKE